MPAFKDLTGQKVNNWIIKKFKGFNKHGESLWSVQCDCVDKTTEIKRISSIKKFGKCNKCVQREKLEQKKAKIIGSKYGKLTIVDYFGYRDDVVTNTPFWIAKCDCGSNKEIIATLYDLKKGRVKSCGCLRFNEPDMEMINRKFGKLTVKEFVGKNEKFQFLWKCTCDCGKKNVIATTSDLETGIKKSCGCLCDEITTINISEYGFQRKKYNKFIEKEDYYIGITDNGEFIFDKDDYDKILAIDKYWKINDAGYVLCNIGGREYQLHRYLMGLGKYNKTNDIIVDHINGNKLDNRKSNLRIIHRKNNAKNCSLYSNNTSGVKGISWNKKLEKWQVNIQVDKKSKYLGLYKDFDEAIEVRKQAEIKYFGEFSRDYGNAI